MAALQKKLFYFRWLQLGSGNELKIKGRFEAFLKGETSRAFPTNPPCFITTESHRRSSACSRGCRADSLGRGGGRQAKARSTGIGDNALGFTGLERACTAPRVVIPGVVRRARRRTPKARAPVPAACGPGPGPGRWNATNATNGCGDAGCHWTLLPLKAGAGQP